jgi:hypothetical protein
VLSATIRKLTLAAHITTGGALIGADLALLTLGLSGLRGTDPQTIYPAAHVIGNEVVAPLTLVALATGLVLAFGTSWGLFRYAWPAAKLLITAGLTAAVRLLLLARLDDAATAPDAVSDRTQVVLVAAPAAALTLLVFNMLLATYKPRWRLRAAAEPTAATI